MIFLLFLTLFFQSNAGYQDLSPDIFLNWTFPSNNSIFFVLGVNSEIYSDTNWVGIGFKSADGGQDMSNADITTFYEGSLNNCQDRYSAEAAIMPTLVAVSYDVCNQRQNFGNFYYYSWTRPLNIQGNMRVTLYENIRIMVIWAQGPMNAGDIAYHGNGDKQRGHQIVTLSTNYDNGVLSISKIFQITSIVYLLL